MNIFEISVTGAVLIFAVILFRAVVKKRLPMRTFTVLWHVTLLRLFLPVELPSPISAASIGQKLIRSWRQADLWKETVMSNSAPAQAAPSTPQDPVFSGSAGGTILFEHSLSDASSVSGSGLPPAPNMQFAPDWRLIVWIAGAVLLLSVFTAFYIRSVKQFRQSLPLKSDFARDWLAVHAPRRKIEVRVSDRIDSPLTYGIFCPVILLPSDTDLADTRRLEFVLAHELNHIRYFDSLTKLLLALAVSLHWFNPAAWLMFFFFNRDMELACDEAVVRMFGGDARREYALMLVEMIEKKPMPVMPVSGFGQGALKERIGAIMKVKRITWAVSLAAVIAVCGITAVFATTAAKEEPEKPDQTAEQTEQTEQTDRTGQTEPDALPPGPKEQPAPEEEPVPEPEAQSQTEDEEPEADIPLWEQYNMTEEEFMSEKNRRFREKLEEKIAQKQAEEAGEGVAEYPTLPGQSTREEIDYTAPEYDGEKYEKVREKYIRKKAEQQAEKEREEAERQIEKHRAANEKWLYQNQFFDGIGEILLTGEAEREDRLSRLDALILEFRADYDYDDGAGCASFSISDTAAGEPEWAPDADLHYEAMLGYYGAFSSYGVTYERRPGTETGDPYWNGQPVTSWEDILFSADGKTVRRFYVAEHNFTDAVSVRVVYDGETVVGVEVNPNR